MTTIIFKSSSGKVATLQAQDIIAFNPLPLAGSNGQVVFFRNANTFPPMQLFPFDRSSNQPMLYIIHRRSFLTTVYELSRSLNFTFTDNSVDILKCTIDAVDIQ